VAAEPARRGRPRRADVDTAILDAAAALLAERGYARMSMEAVAELAGVGKPTVYRRWESKEELAAAAVAAMRDPGLPEDTEDPRADAIRFVRETRVGIGGKGDDDLAMIGTMLAEEARHPELLESFRDQLIRPRRRHLMAILRRAQQLGQLREDTDLELAAHMLIGPYFSQYVAGRPRRRNDPEKLVDAVWRAFSPRS